MGCESCGKSKGSHSPGCQSNGNCGTSGCNRLNSYDWLNNMAMPEDMPFFDVVEVQFKGNRKQFYRNQSNLDFLTGDHVVVDSDVGSHIGRVSMSGELVKLQLKKRRVDANSKQMLKIQRVATESDIEKYNHNTDKEAKTLERARTMALQMSLKMKLSDIEIQADGRKTTFYYTAEGRVDFRELIKRFASEFRSRIQMKQVSYREEASRLGGIGTCGRDLCCSSWLTDFKIVPMSAAKKQNLTINMLKLSGQCGRLKCCLNYELDLYVDALEEFPKEDQKLETKTGVATLRKVDILKRTLWYAYEGKYEWIPLNLDRVNEIIAKNRKGNKPETLAEIAKGAELKNMAVEFDQDLLKDSDIGRLDHLNKKGKGKPRGKGKRNFRGKKRNPNQKNQQGQKPNPNKNPQGNSNQNKPKGKGPNNKNRNRNRRKPGGSKPGTNPPKS